MIELTAGRVKREEVMHLSRQLGAFVQAGLPLIDAVHTLGIEARNSSVRRMMQQLEDGLRGGARLSDCLDRLLLALPVVGHTIRFALVERFARILSSMVSAGLALPEALRVATDSLRNLVFVRALGRVGEAMMEAQGLAGPMAATGLLPAI